MRQIWGREILNGTLGLSCIENYVLGTLRQELPEYEWLYYQSYIPIEKIFEECVGKHTPYAYFHAVPRIQETAGEDGILRWEWGKSNSLQLPQRGHCCARIWPAYLKEKYGEKVWRDDHYFLIRRQDDGYAFLNDNPLDEGVISESEWEMAYTGERIYFSIEKGIDNAQKMHWRDWLFSQMQSNVHVPAQAGRLYEDDLIPLRDFIGVLRVLRKRLERFVRLFTALNMEAYFTLLDKSYMQLEYMRLRGRFDADKSGDMLEQIYMADQIGMKLIRKRMKKFYE